MARQRSSKNNEVLNFVSELGHRPIFFVPDTGDVGGTATVDGPDGSFQTDEGEPTDDGRVGFQFPEPFTEPGIYTFKAEGLTYEIFVVDPEFDRKTGEARTPEFSLAAGNRYLKEHADAEVH
jgi:hypothetical protein